MISSPGLSLGFTKLCATRLIPSVVPLTKITSSFDGAPIKSATVCLAPSYASVDLAARVCAPL